MFSYFDDDGDDDDDDDDDISPHLNSFCTRSVKQYYIKLKFKYLNLKITTTLPEAPDLAQNRPLLMICRRNLRVACQKQRRRWRSQSRTLSQHYIDSLHCLF